MEQYPTGMNIANTINGDILVSWIPSDNDVGDHKVVIKVSDEEGGKAFQKFTLKVNSGELFVPANAMILDYPKIEPIPLQTGKVSKFYSYTIKTTSKNNFEKLTYSLLEYPSGMTINSSTGEISWTPEESQEGDQNVAVKLIVTHSDGSLLSEDKKTFIINVSPADHKSDMVFIPAGEFWLGSTTRTSGWKNAMKWEEPPLVNVYLDDYYMDRYEVTNLEFEEFCASTICSYWRYRYEVGKYRSNKPKQPITDISWNSANDYCKRKGKRLPTDSEWEKAARGGIYLDGDISKKMKNRNPKREYPWGDENPRGRANFDHQNIKWDRDYNVFLKDVGSYVNGKSPYGLYDMAGNAAEWVADYYEEYFYEKLARRRFVKNPINDSFFTVLAVGNQIVVRGGSLFSDESELRVARRASAKSDSQDYNYYGLGFRCAK